MGKRLPRCSHREHDWKPVKRRGPCREKCTKCGDVFPCRHDCEHLDCVVATGRAIPDCWANPEQARANMLEELAIIAPQVYLLAQKPKRKRVARALPEAA
jgi:hypothetical protein